MPSSAGRFTFRVSLMLAVLLVGSLAFAACGDDTDDDSPEANGASENGDAGDTGNGGESDGGNDGDGEAETAEWPSFFDLPSLIEASDAIVVARLEEEQTETIDVPAQDGSESGDSVTEIVRTFVAEESIKGDIPAGDSFTVFNTANVVTDPGDGSPPREDVFQVLRIQDDETYLLFLTPVEVPGYYPEAFGEQGWAAPGEPHTARVLQSGNLEWETTGRYDDAMESRDIDPGESGAGSAFESTLELVAGLAQGSGATPGE